MMSPQPHEPEIDNVEEEILVGLPGFQTGSEAAVIHEEAIRGSQVINYYFPVEVEVVGTLGEIQMQRIAEYVFDELNAALRSQA